MTQPSSRSYRGGRRRPGGRPAPVLATLLVGWVGVGCSGCSKPPAPAEPPTGVAWFRDVTDEVGLEFVHQVTVTPTRFMPEIVGSGAAAFDFDGDGRLDLYLLNNAGPGGAPNRLYRQTPDGRFEDVTRGSGLDVDGFSMGVAVGDVNNDGRPDVLLTQYGGIRLFLNLGGGRFRDATAESGLTDPAWATSAAFVDFDRDGWLDLVVANYVDYDPTWQCAGASGLPDYCAPKVFRGRVTKLFRNLGGRAGVAKSTTRFEDVTVPAGLGKLIGPGLGVVCGDLTGDGWPDIFVANDGQPNRLWVNRHDGTFAEEAIPRGLAFNATGVAQAGMGVALGDVDGAGAFGVFCPHLKEETHTLWRQGPAGLFTDVTTAAGLSRTARHGTGFGTCFADFDHDGWVDLAVVNGAVLGAPEPVNPALGPHWGKYAQQHEVFRNDGRGRFLDVSAANPAVCGTASVGRGLVHADFDGDGAVDLLVTSVGGRARMYRNVARDRGHWVIVRAIDPALNRDALGAEMKLGVGGRTLLGLLHCSDSYLCSNPAEVHFGLGAAEAYDAVTVRWPGGETETFPAGPADRRVTLVKGSGTPAKGEGKRAPG